MENKQSAADAAKALVAEQTELCAVIYQLTEELEARKERLALVRAHLNGVKIGAAAEADARQAEADAAKTKGK